MRYRIRRLPLSLLLCLVVLFSAVTAFLPTKTTVYAQTDGCSEEQLRDLGVAIINCEGDSVNSCSASLPGNDNPEKVWNYLINKGLTITQAAGAMGNLQHEGNFNPKIVEGGGLRSGRWVYDTPFSRPSEWTSEMETMPEPRTTSPPNGPAGQPGYGIVQWTSLGRKQGLLDLAKERSLLESDLALQLDYMWQELSGPYKEAALDPLMAATTLEEAVRIWQDHYEVGRNFEPRIKAAREWLAKYGSGTPSAGSSASFSSSCIGSSNIEGLVCPADMEAHPSREGYFKLPPAPNGEYEIYSIEARQYGSEALVCTIYTVALAFNDAMQGRSKLRIGDLNATGHSSHNRGVAVDLSGFGELQVGSHTKSWKGSYDKDATILLGKMFADTGQLRNIWWCDPGDDSTEKILEYAESNNLIEDGGQIKCIEGHSDHFHVDILSEHRLDFWEP